MPDRKSRGDEVAQFTSYLAWANRQLALSDAYSDMMRWYGCIMTKYALQIGMEIADDEPCGLTQTWAEVKDFDQQMLKRAAQRFLDLSHV